MIGYLPSRNIGGKVMPKVSVLIPVYNAEKYLCQCLKIDDFHLIMRIINQERR